jgi:hypothetical protein
MPSDIDSFIPNWDRQSLPISAHGGIMQRIDAKMRPFGIKCGFAAVAGLLPLAAILVKGCLARRRFTGS